MIIFKAETQGWEFVPRLCVFFFRGRASGADAGGHSEGGGHGGQDGDDNVDDFLPEFLFVHSF